MFSDKELARMRAEEEEAGIESGPVPETVIFESRSYESISPNAGGIRSSGYPDGNPKTAMGAKKPDISVIPPAGILHLATAMMNGANKYGPFNWRDHPISARPYVAAAQRHLLSYLDGEDFSQDTTEAGQPVHHLAHVMACCAILLDATELQTLNDNRPTVKGPSGDMIEFFNKAGSFGQPCKSENVQI
jgi:hypothetical protein